MSVRLAGRAVLCKIVRRATAGRRAGSSSGTGSTARLIYLARKSAPA